MGATPHYLIESSNRSIESEASIVVSVPKLHGVQASGVVSSLVALTGETTSNAGALTIFGKEPGFTIVSLSVKAKIRYENLNDTFTEEELEFVKNIPVTVSKNRGVARMEWMAASLDILDDNTTKHLYGEKALEQFYVLRMTMRNDLNRFQAKNARGEVIKGDTILVYSDSLSVPVKIMQLHDKRYKNLNVQSGDVKRSKNDYKYWAPVNEPDRKHLSGYDNVQPELPLTAQDRGYFFSYRPYAAQMISSTADRRNAATSRNHIFKGLDIIGNIGAFLTGVKVLRGSSNAVLNQYSNSLIPNLGKSFQDGTELQQLNIATRGMKEIEEIPFGSQISRDVFMPKMPISGVLDERLVRISEVDTKDLYVRVSIVDKTNETVGRPTVLN